MEKAGRKLGLRVAVEGFCDRQYDDDGNLTSRKIPGSVLKDAAMAAKQVIDMVVNNFITSRNGKKIPCKVHSLCVHGDEPTGVATARTVREALEKAGVKLVPLTEMTLD
jgi:5-oxoprolinase (ATP-hydrolysing) subunit A